MLTTDKGLALGDESSNTYLLAYPDVDAQFLDYQLWARLGGTAIVYRIFALLAMAASIVPAAIGAWRLFRDRIEAERRPGIAVPAMMTAIGALGLLASVRFTMNYSYSGAIASNLIAGILVCRLGRAGTGGALLAGAAIGPCIALLLLSRFPAVPLAALLVGFASAVIWWSGRRLAAGALLGAALASGAVCCLLLHLAGFHLRAMLEIGAAMGRSYSDPLPLIRADAIRFGAIFAVCALFAAPPIVGERMLGRPWSASVLSAYSIAVVLLILAGQTLHQLARYARIEGSVSPFVTNMGLYSFTYGYFAIIAYVAAILVHRSAFVSGQRSDVTIPAGVLILLCGLLLPFAGTNTGILPRAAENSGMIVIVLMLPLGLLAFRHARPALFAVASVAVATFMTATITYNAVLAPFSNSGSIFAQTVRLATPAALAGVKVTPELATFQQRMTARLAQDGFDPARDMMLPPETLPGFALLAGARLAGPPYLPDQTVKGAEIYYCDGIARAVAVRPRRIFVFNPDALAPPIAACLAALGYPLTGAAIHPIDRAFGYAIVVDRGTR